MLPLLDQYIIQFYFVYFSVQNKSIFLNRLISGQYTKSLNVGITNKHPISTDTRALVKMKECDGDHRKRTLLIAEKRIANL